MKKLGIACAVCCLLALLLPATALAAESERLTFSEYGQFSIMVVADTQDKNPPTTLLTDTLARALDEEQPDLVILLGDQLEGGHPLVKWGDAKANCEKAIAKLLAPVTSRGIPFAVVLGNHDAECGLSREELIAIYMKLPGCLAVDEGADIPGCGTYSLPVYGEDGRTKLNLYLIDSLDYDEAGGYAAVSQEQIDYCAELGKALAEENGGPVPAMAFQHIVVPEIYDELITVEKGVPGALEKTGRGEAEYVTVDSAVLVSGALNEAPCPPDYSSGQFAGWKAQGDVFAAFFGHDHTNTYVIEHEGIDLVACPGATYASYNDPKVRSVRMITVNEDNPQAYDTYLVSFSMLEQFSFLQRLEYRLFASTGVMSYIKQGLWLLAALVVIVLAIVLPATAKARKKKRAAKARAKA